MKIYSKLQHGKTFVLTGEDCQVIAAVAVPSGYCDLCERIAQAIREHSDCTGVGFISNTPLSETAEIAFDCRLSYENSEWDGIEKFYLAPVAIY